ncbi:MAG: hypothetical protein ACTHJU_06375 [Sphingopyxis sp.]
MQKWVVGCAMAMMLTGCWDPAPLPESSREKAPLQWTKLKDGSSFARDSIEAQGKTFVSSVTRCWPVSEGFDCVHISRTYADSGDITNVTLDYDETLPDDGIPSSVVANNYHCQSYMGIREEIGTGPLVSRNVLLQGRWSKSFVNGFLADNGISGRWFGCVDILRAVDSGSLETLGTTLVTRRMALGS